MKTPQELEAELKSLKEKHGKVRTIICPLDEDDPTKLATIYLRKPDRLARKMAGDLAMKDPFKAMEASLKMLFIGGDDLNLILKNDDAMASMDQAMQEFFTVETATLKKN